MVWALKTGLTTPQVVALVQSQELFWSLMCLCSIITIISFDILPFIYEFGFGFSFFGLFGAPARVCTALVEDQVLTSKY